jgi:acyl dehydratase
MAHMNHTTKLDDLVGKEIHVSDWFVIDQEMVNQFAEMSLDQQWIHVDLDRASDELPATGTIVHGLLTLSMITRCMKKVILPLDAKVKLLYGLDRVRFTAPNPVGRNLRGRVTLSKYEGKINSIKIFYHIKFELENQTKPVCVADFIVQYVL